MAHNPSPIGGKFRLAELIICVVVVILGLVYLNTSWIPLGVLLPVYAVFFGALPVFRFMEMRAKGSRGFFAMLPALCYVLLAFVVMTATVLYFVK